MTFSDALPVQFWAGSAETYNEKTPQGVFSKCFCSPWKCTDTIRVQFTETGGQEFSLAIVNSDEEIVGTVQFTEVANGVYSAVFSPEDEGVCDEIVSLEVTSSDFLLLAPSAWTDGSGIGVTAFDTKTATTFTEALTSTDETVSAEMPLVVPSGAVITINYTVAVSGTWVAGGAIPIFISFTLKDSGGNTVSTGSLTVPDKTITANGTYQYTEILTATGTSAVLDLDLVEVVSSGTADIIITISPGELLYSDGTAKSDCLSVKTIQDETVLITYSDNKNFAGLQYSAISPDPEFNIRIPSTFFHERFPEESEVIELSNSRSIQLNAQVKAQRKLEIGPMPYYMHRKLKLILKHQFVEIDSQDWVQSEAYELTEGNRRSPLKQAVVWLDEKDYILRNIL